MKGKPLLILSLLIVFLLGALISTQNLTAQDNLKKGNEEGIDIKFWVQVVLGVVGIYLAVYYYQKSKKEIIKIKEKEQKKAEEDYRNVLKGELGTLHFLGSPDIDSTIVNLADAFVPLHISDPSCQEDPHEPCKQEDIDRNALKLSPNEVMRHAFAKYRVLMVIGDPGSGKTTLLKYYALNCLDKTNKQYKKLGFTEEVLPIYFPLGELEFKEEDNKPISFPENLEKWSDERQTKIPEIQFFNWLKKRKTLILLDGLDEIGNKKRRQYACRWIKHLSTVFSNAFFVVTSRATGYRKLDGIELEVPNLKVDIMDFSIQQQEEFLKKWYRAVLLNEKLPPKDIPKEQWINQQGKRAEQQSQKIIKFLSQKENQTMQQLAAVPMLLQIMAITWKDCQQLPQTRAELYNNALNYLLEYRDHLKNIEPILPAEEARRVLAPVALWMQEELGKDEIPKKQMLQLMQAVLDSLEGSPNARVFCENLRDRSGLIIDYDRDHYTFRHKSFREFLAALQLREDARLPKRIQSLVKHFKEDWWQETLRFFISMCPGKTFDDFMRYFFLSEVSSQLDVHQQTFLHHLIREAPHKNTDALVEALNTDRLNNNQRRYVMDCLKVIRTPDSLNAIMDTDKSKWDKYNRGYAADIIAEAAADAGVVDRNKKPGPIFQVTGDSFRNPFEGNVEYIKIPGGSYKYSVSGKIEAVPGLYFCKYPVTNKQYRRFISFLEGKEKDIESYLPPAGFARKLLEFACTIKGYGKFLGQNPDEWHKKFRSRFDEDKRFKGEDQPVLVSDWFAARAYCFWLSCLELVQYRGIPAARADAVQLAALYRLPQEVEWEWAACGVPNGAAREYPWPKDRGKPDPNFANYNNYAGATTPVGRYPKGATPAGLMDMAGNVWEWMENYYDEERVWFALRGGSWRLKERYLSCTARLNPAFRSDDLGFRVVRSID